MYIQKTMSILKKKLKHKVKIASAETESEQNKLYFNRKDMGPVENKARLNWTK